MLRKKRGKKTVPIIHLLLSVLLVCFAIYSWKELDCPGYPDSYLCRTFTPDYFLNPSAVSSSADDFTRLVDLTDFTFLMNGFVCNDSDLFLLVLVHSHPYNHEIRATIRSTWGRVNSDRFKLLFLVGIPNSSLTQNYLVRENNANGDLVQGNFVDTYRNLTYKHVMALKWTRYFCPQAKYLLKTDDDVFVNSPILLRYAEVHLPKKTLMRCLPIYESRAKRTFRSKWRVTWSEYKFQKYPPFCNGFAILYSSDVVLALYEKAQIANYFWIDDVFVTGCLAMAANLTPSTFGNLIFEPHDLHLLNSKDSAVFSYLLGPYNLKVADIRKLWKQTRERKNLEISF